MMAAVFLLFSLAITAALLRHRLIAIALIIIGLISGAIVFSIHFTDIVKINL